ncbi:MAG: mobilization protein [Coriobacteriia bacterium]|nr:mobilization protein [Coriobacteriia bacterium]
MQKSTDSKGRWRSLAVAFRMSPEESADLDIRVKLSGLTKQEYFLRRISEREVVVQGNPRVHKALRNQMADILQELKRLESAGEADEEFLATLRLVAQTVDGMKEEQLCS